MAAALSTPHIISRSPVSLPMANLDIGNSFLTTPFPDLSVNEKHDLHQHQPQQEYIHRREEYTRDDLLTPTPKIDPQPHPALDSYSSSDPSPKGLSPAPSRRSPGYVVEDRRLQHLKDESAVQPAPFDLDNPPILDGRRTPTTAVSQDLSRASTLNMPKISVEEDTVQTQSQSQTPVPMSRPSIRDSRVPQLLELAAQIPSSPRHPSAPRSPAGPRRESISKSSPNAIYGPSSSMPIPIPISPTRAYARQPQYATSPQISQGRSLSPNPVQSLSRPAPRVQEEVCVECAMRDQDMADVDVTSPGVWDRESDVAYQDLCRREAEDDSDRITGREPIRVDPTRPRARGDPLSEQNLRVWLSINPREPQARQQNIELFVRTQNAFLEAEALARARALRESRLIENKMRDTYDQLRKSTYDLHNGGHLIDDVNGLRVKSTRSVSGPSGIPGVGAEIVQQPYHGLGHSRHHSREVTLLENGMLVEHVDVKREEKEERERRRKEERRDRSRARKASKGSAVDITSMYSTQSPLPHPDSGFHSMVSNGAGDTSHLGRPSSRYSQSSSRPLSPTTLASMPTTPITKPASSNRRLQSQVSLLDNQSVISSASMGGRQSRFFSFRNLSGAWRSRESFAASGFSGSMMDMHVALQRENNAMRASDMDSATPTLRQLGAVQPEQPTESRATSPARSKKKKGIGKIWRLITGSKSNGSSGNANANGTTDREIQMRPEDDLPLDPPPPISYLVSRNSGDRPMSISGGNGGGGAVSHHMSSPSLSMSQSPNRSSFVSVPSSVLATPSSQYPRYGTLDGRKSVGMDADFGMGIAVGGTSPIEEESGVAVSSGMGRGVHPVASEPDMRQKSQEPLIIPTTMFPSLSTGSPIITTQSPMQGSGFPGATSPRSRPLSIMSLQKSLPPLPVEALSADMDSPAKSSTTVKPNTFGVGDDGDDLGRPQPPFRTAEMRRQSFGGMASKPVFGQSNTMPMMDARRNTHVEGMDMGPNRWGNTYAEFGASHHSLGRLDDMAGGRRMANGYNHSTLSAMTTAPSDPTTPKKRRSKFGLGGLFGKLSNSSNHRSNSNIDSRSQQTLSVSEYRDSQVFHQSSESEMRGAELGYQQQSSQTGYATSASRHTVSTNATAPRMSVASRKAIEELVDQDPEFVAYRYPSAAKPPTELFR